MTLEELRDHAKDLVAWLEERDLYLEDDGCGCCGEAYLGTNDGPSIFLREFPK